MKVKLLLVGIIVLITGLSAQDPSFSGLTFFEYRFGEQSYFEVNRAYFTFKKPVSKALSYKFQLDVGREKIPSLIDSLDYSVAKTRPTRLFAYLKNAKLDWKTPVGKITVGLQGMNMFNVQEKTWGYRYIEKSAMDLNKFSSSADLGLGYANTLGPVQFSLLYTNGSGYKKAENDNYKKFSAQFLCGQKKIQSPGDRNVGLVASYEPGASVTTTITGLFGGTKIGSLRLGGEADFYNNETTTKTLLSFYGTWSLSSSFGLLARTDTLDKDVYSIIGLEYHTDQALFITPTIRIAQPKSGTTTTEYILNFQFKV